MTDNHLRIATFNIHHGAAEGSRRGKADEVAKACVALQADIIALQEVDKWAYRSGFKDMARRAAEAAGMKAKFAPSRLQNFVSPYGNALLVRGELTDVEVMALKGDRRHNVTVGDHSFHLLPERRNAILATAHIGEFAVSVATTHVGGKVRRDHLQDVAAKLFCRPGPHILLGDFNDDKGHVRDCIRPYGWELADGPPTNPAHKPGRHIDHIAVGGLAIDSVYALRFPFSDHLALVAEVSYGG